MSPLFQSPSLVTTEDGDRQNMYPIEARPQLVENYTSHPTEAEKVNGRWAMLGFIGAIGAYSTTGQILPGVF